VCCQVLADKPVIVKTGEAQGTLGTWRCSSCRKACKVTVCDKAKYLPVQKVEPVQGMGAIDSLLDVLTAGGPLHD
jgi:hypothetical protein